MALKIHVYVKEGIKKLAAVAWRVPALWALRAGCGEVNLAERGDLAGWQMVEDDAVQDKHSRFAGTPVVDRRRCPAQALGQGMGGTQEVPLRWALPGLNICPFLLCLYFLGASEAFSLAERESGLLQYSSALWWWVSTRANSWLTFAFPDLNHVSWPLFWWRVFLTRRQSTFEPRKWQAPKSARKNWGNGQLFEELFL